MSAYRHWRLSKPATPRTGLARALSKLGFCSRSQAWEVIQAGRVRLNGVVRRDPEWPVNLQADRLEVDGRPVGCEAKVYLMLNKPRGLVTTASDERGRPTVFDCLAGHHLPFVSPVGRLDQASEGLLLFTNDTAWAARLTAPESHVEKVYHVQINCLATGALLESIRQGCQTESGVLQVKDVQIHRTAVSRSWLKITLTEGKNRHIRRLLEALRVEVVRLVRISIGPLVLGELPKGSFRRLTPEEVKALAGAAQ